MAGPITNLLATFNVNCSFAAPQTDPILGTRNISSALGLQQIFGTASGANLGGNQLKAYTPSIAASGNTTIDLSAASNNILTNSAATLARIFGILIWLPTTTQNASLGSLASSITVGDAASTAVDLFGLGATATITLNLGEVIFWQTNAGGTAGTSGGLVVGTNKSLKIANNDGTNAATPVILVVGNDA